MITPVFRGDDVMAFPSPASAFLHARFSLAQAKASFQVHNKKTVPTKRT
mgnify:FL=1|jgi:hypothetical protein